MKKFKIDDIVVFGKSSEPMSLDDLDKFEINPTNEFHILRHFSDIDTKYSQTLIDQEYFYYDHDKKHFKKSVISSGDIQTALKTKGTKFFNDIEGIKTPRELLTLIKEKLKEKISSNDISWICKEKSKTAMFSFEYKEDVGEEDLIPVSSLSKQEKSKVKRVPRSKDAREASLLINTISGIKRAKTKTISVEITDVPELAVFFVTSYPSGLGPDFPDANQGAEEYEYNQKYWDNHVFVV